MLTASAKHAQTDLKEGLREIQIMAGFDPGEPGTHEGRPLAIGVTSPNFGDGKTTVSMALAASLAQDFDVDVKLVDCDFHTHSLASEYGLLGEVGVADVIQGEIPLTSVVHRVSQLRMDVVTAGRLPADPARIARSQRLSLLIENLKAASQFVVIDLPATLHSMNAPVLAKRCDAVIVVVNHGKTTVQELERVLELLKDSNVIGVVVNRQETRVPKWARRAFGLGE